ncbi:MAG TPA: QsdR family transcriptional regulator [Solirubrobacteraceae bacterium]|jgi:AcrR family transcriptional regulator|nr:QsdR family transcriptional regulator [Solirubrobacteraceae bacterium]
MIDAKTDGSGSAETGARRRGRTAGATREDVLGLAMSRFLRGRRVDVQEIAGELGIGRTTIYRWFGSRDDLIGEVVVRAAEPLLEQASGAARTRGAAGLLETFDAFNRQIAAAPALLRFVESEREAALRVITSGASKVQPRIVEMITELILAEVDAGRYDPPVDPSTLGYAIVRIAEAFLYNDAVAGMRGDVERLREVQGALLGLDGASPRRVAASAH